MEAKFLEKIKEQSLDNGKSKDLNTDELSKLVYLRGSICESLRLFLLVQLYLSIENVHFNLIFFLAVTLPDQIQECVTFYSQWEGLLGLQAKEMDFSAWRNSVCTIFQVHRI